MAFNINCTYCVGIIVRLVGGSSYYEGRVEVNYNGEWGRVCSNRWSYYNGYVVCRQLGLGTYGYSGYYYGQGSGPIWLSNVICTGSESTIARCGHLGVNITTSCSYYGDMGVRCYGRRGIIAPYVYSLENLHMSFFL